jgi:hypothetical protein
MTSRFRVYFTDEAGAELVSHPAHGQEWAASGAFLIRAGQSYRGLKHEVEVRIAGRLHVLTAADFGGRPVRVKVWHPDGVVDRFRLVPLEAGDIDACAWPGAFPPAAPGQPTR